MNSNGTSLAGKVALVSGASRGIGAAAAIALASRGAAVAVNYSSSEESAQAVVQLIRESGGKAEAVRADVRDPVNVLQAVAQTEAALGTIDILVNNANMAFVMKPLSEMTWEEFAQKLNDELKAAFNLTQAVLPSMLSKQWGRLIYISSNASDIALPYMAAHGSAKAALNAYAKYVALENAPHGITANIVSPGLVRTEASSHTPESVLQQMAAMTPLRRIALPDDIAGAIAFLGSDDSRFLTGTCTYVNGGSLMA
ncbi:SDR family NAD(P)-dependent oxidoreductase [Cohnella fermenti]|uniref:SDR family oxidoreductase n=1 Tax=Cohnella fermenti TaxID=2565925 RepID=A0A4S4C5W7_9BACL|nr:SDR family oxidoreductase [Cohnella fermenti]THF83253.1 SDR family oxidoreductase [Cohnella fermenti]